MAAAEVMDTGPDLAGIAAVIAASAGMVSAIGAIVIALKRKPDNSEDQARDELLMKLIAEKLEREEGQ